MNSSAMEQTRDYTEVIEVLDKYNREPSRIIPILQDVQAIFRFLPKDVMIFIAKEMKISSSKVYGISTFYNHFSLVPKGKYEIKVCNGTACHVKGSGKLIEKFLETLNLPDGEITTPDGVFSFETVACLGACGLAPAVVINDDVYGEVTPGKAVKLHDKIKVKESDHE
jgi:NADH-quinone oxidoreductase subunit E